MTFRLCTSYAIIRKAGLGASNAIIASGAALYDWCSQAEAQVCRATQRNWITSSGSAYLMPLVADAVSDCAAMKVISYNMRDFTSRLEAATVLDVLDANYRRCIEQLKDKNNSFT